MILAVVIALLIVPFLVNVAAWWLDLRALERQPPPDDRELRSDPGPELALAHLERTRRFSQTQAYTRVKIKLAVVSSTVGLLATLAFWLAGGFGAADRWVASWQLPPMVAGLTYFGLLMFARRLALLTPFVVYQDFVMEERFGFNRYTPFTFTLDFLKWRMINGVIWGLAAACALALFAWGTSAWWCVWLAVAALTVAVTFVAPNLIQPLFYRFTPLPEGEIKQRITALASRLGYPLAGIFVINSSRQTSKSEAICFGLGRNLRVALSDTVLSRHPADELCAIVAHEVGHARHHHMLKHLAAVTALYAGLCFLLARMLGSDQIFAAFGVAQPSPHVGLVLFLLFYGVWQTLLTTPIKWFRRRAEYQADAFAAAAVGDPGIVARMLERIAGDNLVNVQPHPFSVLLNAVHPTVVDRIAALGKLGTATSR